MCSTVNLRLLLRTSEIIDSVLKRGVIFVSQSPNPQAKKLLYIIGVSVGLALLSTALIYLLLGIGIIKSISTYVIWAIILFSIGAGILSGVSRRGY
ncbi:hypothetical protein NIES4106_38570 [Fischerella sp. NIES-4106]|jgi:hypothetical protein|nr:hypothetical protein NIES4106_38570 [Fischerella sp. NIES-4106]